MENKFYTLPDLPYGYKDLEPYMSEEQLKLHHDKHHLAYVNGANAILEKLEKSRKDGVDIDMKSFLKELSFHISGHILHSLFWKNMDKAMENNRIEGSIKEAIEKNFNSFERFKKEFSQAAVSVEGSGWAVLVYDKKVDRLMLMQVEKHNLNIFATLDILLVLDVWEHSYYLDYKNDRVKFIEAFFNIINWEEVSSRLKKAKQSLN